MKFFSNEKDNEAEYANDPDRTQAVTSEPVAVPVQRAGSPWSDRPGGAEAPEGPEGNAPEENSSERTDDATATYGSDERAAGYQGHHADAPPVAADGDRTAVIDGDRPAEPIKDEGTFESPQAVEPATGEPLDARSGRTDEAIKDEGTFDSPTAVEPATGEPFDDGKSPDSPTTEPVAAGEPSPAPATPAPTAGDRLLPDGDTFAERFRDIQLRFVDDPKDATAEASRLVEEVVDKLTSTLKSQRDALGGNADDTEKLRVELRGYRDILNRLLSL